MRYKSYLTYFFAAVAEQVLVHRLVAVLVVELGGHGVAVAGDGQEVLDVTDRRPPVELLGPHPGPRPHIASSWSLSGVGSLMTSLRGWSVSPMSGCVSGVPDSKLVTGDNSATRTFVIKMTTSNGGPTNRKLAKYPPKLIC